MWYCYIAPRLRYSAFHIHHRNQRCINAAWIEMDQPLSRTYTWTSSDRSGWRSCFLKQLKKQVGRYFLHVMYVPCLVFVNEDCMNICFTAVSQEPLRASFVFICCSNRERDIFKRADFKQRMHRSGTEWYASILLGHLSLSKEFGRIYLSKSAI